MYIVIVIHFPAITTNERLTLYTPLKQIQHAF